MASHSRTRHQSFWILCILSALGPKITHLKLRVPANQAAELDFTKYGITEGATVLQVNYTPHDNSLPIELHGNTPPRRFGGTKVNSYGLQARSSDGAPHEERLPGDNVSVMVLWAPAEESISWVYFVDAIGAVTLARFSQAIVPAHAAVEISITPAINSVLRTYSGKEHVERLLRRELGFSSILNVVIPLVCALIGAKVLPDAIRGNLNALRELRNEFVHEGVLPSQGG